MNNIMLDLETLATSPKAVVVALGAVAFDPLGDGIGETFYLEASDLTYQQRQGREVDANTVTWWMNQGAEARQVFAERAVDYPSRAITHDLLVRFSDFVTQHGDRNALIWGNGSDFDNIILGSLYDDLNRRKPWSYSRNRCFRTMKALRPDVKVVRAGIHHHALDDAVTQALHLQAIFRALKGQP